ncbi:hypothetical protein VP01_2741g1 [Puccinia sorghi]|uniref:DDE Tnp4 domain-containing protein n=1 Tax=Puccinia sorghi TaxID=27349 RepID=A0A0L6V365_9BASI|nr:hypothetical protein VP01_2741g1 [Puccinia sorghi]
MPSHVIPAGSCGTTIGSRQSVLWNFFLAQDPLVRGQPLSVEAQVAVGLYRLGHGSSHVTIGHVLNMGKEMAEKASGRFVNVILQVFRKHVVRWAFSFTSHCFFVLMLFLPLRFPPLDQPDQWSAIMDSFKNRHGIAQIVGAIDGTHIPISNPPHDEWKGYINRKSWSIVFQCVVDGKDNLRNICGGGAGLMHDSRVFQWFNYIQSSTRIIVEQAFGQLKNWFCLLLSSQMASPRRARNNSFANGKTGQRVRAAIKSFQTHTLIHRMNYNHRQLKRYQ